MSLTPKQQQALKAKAHHLNPVVIIGDKGLTENVFAEIDIALSHHELMKVKINGADKTQRTVIADEIVDKLECELVQHIGRVLILFREKPAD